MASDEYLTWWLPNGPSLPRGQDPTSHGYQAHASCLRGGTSLSLESAVASHRRGSGWTRPTHPALQPSRDATSCPCRMTSKAYHEGRATEQRGLTPPWEGGPVRLPSCHILIACRGEAASSVAGRAVDAPTREISFSCLLILLRLASLAGILPKRKRRRQTTREEPPSNAG